MFSHTKYNKLNCSSKATEMYFMCYMKHNICGQFLHWTVRWMLCWWCSVCCAKCCAESWPLRDTRATAEEIQIRNAFCFQIARIFYLLGWVLRVFFRWDIYQWIKRNSKKKDHQQNMERNDRFKNEVDNLKRHSVRFC